MEIPVAVMDAAIKTYGKEKAQRKAIKLLNSRYVTNQQEGYRTPEEVGVKLMNWLQEDFGWRKNWGQNNDMQVDNDGGVANLERQQRAAERQRNITEHKRLAAEWEHQRQVALPYEGLQAALDGILKKCRQSPDQKFLT